MRTLALLGAFLLACTPDTTSSFRSTERIDSQDPELPSPAVYDLAGVARVRVWSTGGYIGTSDDPMTQIGIAVENTGKRPLVFDGDAASLALYDEAGALLPAPQLAVISPLGPSKITIAPGARTTLELHYKLDVKLGRVAAMTARWTLIAGKERIARTTGFVRDDEPALLGR